MADKSVNIGLNLPVSSDKFDHEVFLRENFEKIDEYLMNATNVTAEFNAVNTSLADIAIKLDHYKTGSNTWNDAFELAYSALPQYGGTILIPETIYIQRSINLIALGTKKVMIESNYSNLLNPGTAYNSIIIKQGDFDGVVLNHGSGMRNIGVSRDTAYTDTHDGIYVSGVACILENVGVADQGGNGIRIGSKNNAEYTTSYSCNIGRFTNVRAIHNSGWGIVVRDEFSTGLGTSDANACVFFAPDVRDNTLGGMLFERCIDNIVYSPDCEVNRGEAGIKIGDETSGIHVYSPYTENTSTHDILLTTGSSDCLVWGYRGYVLNDKYTDLGTGNLILGKYKTKFAGFHLNSRLNVDSLAVGKRSTTGYISFEQDASNNLNIVSRGAAGKTVYLTSDAGGNDINLNVKGVLSKNIVLNGKDQLNSIRVRPYSNVSQTIVPASSSVTKTVSTVGIIPGDIVVVNPTSALPSGISYYAYCDTADNVNIVFVNSTAASVTIPAQAFRFLGINTTALA